MGPGLRSLASILAAGAAALAPRDAPAQEPPAADPPAAEPPAREPPASEPAADQPPAKEPANAGEVRAVARRAQLTPLVPSPADPTRPAFQLYAEVDLPLVGIGAVIFASRLLEGAPPYCGTNVPRERADLPRCDKDSLSAVDRPFAGWYSKRWSMASDVGLVGLGVGAATLLLADEGLVPALNDLVVITESALIATALPSLSTFATGRPRPYVYGEEAPLEKRLGASASHSFISSHTSISFAIASSTFVASRRLQPRGPLPYLVFAVGMTSAGFVGFSRVMAGSHFPTDALAGAVMGTSVGVLVSALHPSPVRVVPLTQPATGRGIALAGEL